MAEHAENIGWTHRTYCTTLENARVVLKTLLKHRWIKDDEDISSQLNLLGTLVEEVQVYGDRMEAKLEDEKAYRNMKKEYKELKEEVQKLKESKETLGVPTENPDRIIGTQYDELT